MYLHKQLCNPAAQHCTPPLSLCLFLSNGNSVKHLRGSSWDKALNFFSTTSTAEQLEVNPLFVPLKVIIIDKTQLDANFA